MKATKSFVQAHFPKCSEQERLEKESVLHYEFYTHSTSNGSRVEPMTSELSRSNSAERSKLANWLHIAWQIRQNPDILQKFISDPSNTPSFKVLDRTFLSQSVWALWLADYFELFHLDPDFSFMNPSGRCKTDNYGDAHYKYGSKISGYVGITIMEQWDFLGRPISKNVSPHIMSSNLAVLSFQDKEFACATSSNARLLSASSQQVGIPIHTTNCSVSASNYTKLITHCAIIIALDKQRAGVPFLEILDELHHELAIDVVRRYQVMTIEVPSTTLLIKVADSKDESPRSGSCLKGRSDNIYDASVLRFIEKYYADFEMDANFEGVIQRINDRRTVTSNEDSEDVISRDTIRNTRIASSRKRTHTTMTTDVPPEAQTFSPIEGEATFSETTENHSRAQTTRLSERTDYGSQMKSNRSIVADIPTMPIWEFTPTDTNSSQANVENATRVTYKDQEKLDSRGTDVQEMIETLNTLTRNSDQTHSSNDRPQSVSRQISIPTNNDIILHMSDGHRQEYSAAEHDVAAATRRKGMSKMYSSYLEAKGALRKFIDST